VSGEIGPGECERKQRERGTAQGEEQKIPELSLPNCLLLDAAQKHQRREFDAARLCAPDQMNEHGQGRRRRSE
jgi:hypothetical protein